MHPKGENHLAPSPISRLEIPPESVPFPKLTLPESVKLQQELESDDDRHQLKSYLRDLTFHLFRYITNTRPQIPVDIANQWVLSQVLVLEKVDPEHQPKNWEECLRFFSEDGKIQSMALPWKTWWTINNSSKFPPLLYDSFSAIARTPTEKVYDFELPTISNYDMVKRDESGHLLRLGKLAVLVFSNKKQFQELIGSQNVKKLMSFNFGWNNNINLTRVMGLLSLERSDRELHEWWKGLSMSRKTWNSQKITVALENPEKYPKLPLLSLDEELVDKLRLIPKFEIERMGELFLSFVAAKTVGLHNPKMVDDFKLAVTEYINNQLDENSLVLPLKTKKNAEVYIALLALQSPELTEEFLKKFALVPGYDVWVERIKWTVFDNKLPVYLLSGIEDVDSIFRLPPIPRTTVSSILIANKITISDSLATFKKRIPNKPRPNESSHIALLNDSYSLGNFSYEFHLRRSLIQNLSPESIAFNFPRLLSLFRHPLFYRHVAAKQLERIRHSSYRKLLLKHRFNGSLIPTQFMQTMAIITLYGDQVPVWVNQFVPIMAELYGTLPEMETQALNKTLLQEFKNEQFVLSNWFLEDAAKQRSSCWENFELEMNKLSKANQVRLSTPRLELLGKLYWGVLALVLNMNCGISGFIESKNEITRLFENMSQTTFTDLGTLLADLQTSDIHLGKCLSVGKDSLLQNNAVLFLEKVTGNNFKQYHPWTIPELSNGNTIDSSLDKSATDVLCLPIIVLKGRIPPLSKTLQINYSLSREYMVANSREPLKKCLEAGDTISKMSSLGELYLQYRLEKHLCFASDKVYESMMELIRDKQFRRLVVDHSPGYSLETDEYRVLRARAISNPYRELRYYNWQFRQLVANVIYYDPDRFDQWLGKLLNHIMTGASESEAHIIDEGEVLHHIESFRTRHSLVPLV